MYMARFFERYLLTNEEYRRLHDKKQKLAIIPFLIRNILSSVFIIAFLISLLFLTLHATEKNWFMVFVSFVSTQISLRAYVWFSPNYRELMLDSIKKITKFKEDEKHGKIIDEFDNLIRWINLSYIEEYNRFNIIMFERLGEYIELFIYPILQSNNPKARALIYSQFIPDLENILKDKSRNYKLSKLIEKFDNSFMAITSVKKSVIFYYELDNNFFKQTITKRITFVRKLVDEKTVIKKIISYLVENKQLATAIILIVLFIVLRDIFNIDLPSLP